MLYLKNIVLQLRQRPARSLILAAFLAVTGVMLVLGTYLQSATEGYFDVIAEEAGSSVSVWKKSLSEDAEGTPFSAELLEELLQCDHVTGYNQTEECLCTPVSFVNTGYENNTPYAAEEESEEILLIGNHDAAYYETFRVGTMTLSEGSYPTAEAPGLLIDRYLAEQNNVGVGDTLTFENEAGTAEVSAVVRGIYETGEPPKIDHTDYYAIAASSYVFCDLETTYWQAANIYDESPMTYIYADSYRNVDALVEQMEPILARYSDQNRSYDCISTAKSSTYGEAGSGGLLNFRRLLNSLLLALEAVIVLLSVLMIFLWMQDHQRDIGIYRVLGWSQSRILITLLGEGLLLILCSDMVAGAVGLLFVQQEGKTLFDFFAQTMSGHAQSTARLNDALKLASRGSVLLPHVILEGFLCLLIVFLCGFYSMKQRCHTLLSGEGNSR